MRAPITILAATLALVGTVAMLDAEFVVTKVPLLLMGYAVGASAVATGLWARARWPDSAVGTLLAWSGVMFLATGIAYYTTAASFVVAAMASAVQIGLLGHVMLVLPHERADTPAVRRVVALAYAVPLSSGVAWIVYGGVPGDGCPCLGQALGWGGGRVPVSLLALALVAGYAVALVVAVCSRWARLPRQERDSAVTFSGLLLMLLIIGHEVSNLLQSGGIAAYFQGGLLDSLVVLGFIAWPLGYRVALGRRETARRMAAFIDAGDEARRRIERDLHDGAQQRLVNVRLLLGLARDEPVRLDQAITELGVALEELRGLARGAFPAVLTEAGLGAALRSLAERAALPVRLRIELPVRPMPQVERTAYFVAAEALANAGRHASASLVRIDARLDRGRLIVEVADDGCGGAVPAGGLRGLADRVAACGGDLMLDSPPGGGTTVRALLPAEIPQHGQDPPVVGDVVG
ncbi:Signal transduction histidine kinase [Nonomuraea solani]|uniref:histidine kinase n=1 Tax=Nonomuraea solani TaxID=1144553 RepID=A0A1H6CV31_9ACTN|nr:histidine kinase [Nonomuraea solani]SEG76553.1 Signal transduction histidine kinase [Nonomuraea solani]